MTEQKSSFGQDTLREQLLEQVLESLFTVMKQIHRDIGPHEHVLSPPQARLMFIIAKHQDKGISSKELARICDMTPGAITQFMDALIKKNVVTREEDADDRRIIRLKLAPEAQKHMELARKYFLTAAINKFAVLNTLELQQLNDLITKVRSQSQTNYNEP